VVTVCGRSAVHEKPTLTAVPGLPCEVRVRGLCCAASELRGLIGCAMEVNGLICCLGLIG